MIWTTRQVAAVEGYRFSQGVDEAQLARAAAEDGTNPLMEYVRVHLFEGLAKAVETWGVEIDLRDIEYGVDHDENFQVAQVRARWNPQTREGLLIGGPMGGRSMVLAPELHRRGVTVVVHESTTLFSETAKHPTAPTATYFYQYAGWSEDRRMWVYRVVSEG